MILRKTTNQVHNTLAVTKSAQLGKDKYYLVSDYNSGKLYGWVKQNETIYNTTTSKTKVNKSYTIKPERHYTRFHGVIIIKLLEQCLNQINLHLKRVHHSK